MHWTAPPEKDAARETLVKRLWGAAYQLRAKVNDASRGIEKHNPQLGGVLPKTYNLFSSNLRKELLKKVSEIPATADYDAFGRIYYYSRGKIARTEGQKGGEFYTPSSIARLLAEIIEPTHGHILETLRLANVRRVKCRMNRAKTRYVRGKKWPCASTSGGMFVSSARFVAEHKRQHPVWETKLPSVP
jgi:type I restriction enzyme M protein